MAEGAAEAGAEFVTNGLFDGRWKVEASTFYGAGISGVTEGVLTAGVVAGAFALKDSISRIKSVATSTGDVRSGDAGTTADQTSVVNTTDLTATGTETGPVTRVAGGIVTSTQTTAAAASHDTDAHSIDTAPVTAPGTTPPATTSNNTPSPAVVTRQAPSTGASFADSDATSSTSITARQSGLAPLTGLWTPQVHIAEPAGSRLSTL
ncbi:hypothetical protein ACFQ60_47525 [Streptomyces zhihengii]